MEGCCHTDLGNVTCRCVTQNKRGLGGCHPPSHKVAQQAQRTSAGRGHLEDKCFEDVGIFSVTHTVQRSTAGGGGNGGVEVCFGTTQRTSAGREEHSLENRCWERWALVNYDVSHNKENKC